MPAVAGTHALGALGTLPCTLAGPPRGRERPAPPQALLPAPLTLTDETAALAWRAGAPLSFAAAVLFPAAATSIRGADCVRRSPRRLALFFVGLILAAVVVEAFEEMLRSHVELSYFVPLLIGEGGTRAGSASLLCGAGGAALSEGGPAGREQRVWRSRGAGPGGREQGAWRACGRAECRRPCAAHAGRLLHLERLVPPLRARRPRRQHGQPEQCDGDPLAGAGPPARLGLGDGGIQGGGRGPLLAIKACLQGRGRAGWHARKDGGAPRVLCE